MVGGKCPLPPSTSCSEPNECRHDTPQCLADYLSNDDLKHCCCVNGTCQGVKDDDCQTSTMTASTATGTPSTATGTLSTSCSEPNECRRDTPQCLADYHNNNDLKHCCCVNGTCQGVKDYCQTSTMTASTATGTPSPATGTPSPATRLGWKSCPCRKEGTCYTRKGTPPPVDSEGGCKEKVWSRMTHACDSPSAFCGKLAKGDQLQWDCNGKCPSGPSGWWIGANNPDSFDSCEKITEELCGPGTGKDYQEIICDYSICPYLGSGSVIAYSCDKNCYNKGLNVCPEEMAVGCKTSKQPNRPSIYTCSKDNKPIDSVEGNFCLNPSDNRTFTKCYGSTHGDNGVECKNNPKVWCPKEKPHAKKFDDGYSCVKSCVKQGESYSPTQQSPITVPRGWPNKTVKYWRGGDNPYKPYLGPTCNTYTTQEACNQHNDTFYQCFWEDCECKPMGQWCK